MGYAEKIRLLLVLSGNISEAELARRIGTSPQNFNNKMKRDNFTVSELARIADALDCSLYVAFKRDDQVIVDSDV